MAAHAADDVSSPGSFEIKFDESPWRVFSLSDSDSLSLIPSAPGWVVDEDWSKISPSQVRKDARRNREDAN